MFCGFAGCVAALCWLCCCACNLLLLRFCLPQCSLMPACVLPTAGQTHRMSAAPRSAEARGARSRVNWCCTLGAVLFKNSQLRLRSAVRYGILRGTGVSQQSTATKPAKPATTDPGSSPTRWWRRLIEGSVEQDLGWLWGTTAPGSVLVCELCRQRQPERSVSWLGTSPCQGGGGIPYCHRIDQSAFPR